MAQHSDRQPRWTRFKGTIGKVRHFLAEGIWRLNLAEFTRLQALGVHYVKVLIFLTRQFYADKLLTRASALTYSSLLAIVPFLAVIFSLFKAFGLHMDLASALSNLLSPLGPRGDQISMKVLEFVENSQTGALGVVGFATLLLTVWGILSNIEVSYSEIWHVRRMRAWTRRLVDYVALVVVGPLSVLLVLAATASMISSRLVQEILSYRIFAAAGGVGLRLAPYVLSCLLFTLVIWLVPNTRVHFKPAVAGGCFSGILWQLSNWGFARFVVGASRASAREVLFAGFAALPAEVPSLRELSRELRAPEPVIRDLLEPLVTANILVRAANGAERYLPARDPTTVTMAELLLAFRQQATLPGRLHAQDPFGQYVQRLLRQIDASLEEGAGKFSLHEAALAAGQVWSTCQVGDRERGSSEGMAVIAET